MRRLSYKISGMTLQKFPVSNVVLLEVPANPGSERSTFSDNEKLLDDIFLTGIAVNSNALGKTPKGKNLLTLANLKKSFLTLVNRNTGKEEVKLLPLENLLADEKLFLEFDQFPIDVNKSFISIFDRAGLGAAGTEAFVLTLYFNRTKK